MPNVMQKLIGEPEFTLIFGVNKSSIITPQESACGNHAVKQLGPGVNGPEGVGVGVRVGDGVGVGVLVGVGVGLGVGAGVPLSATV